MSYAIVAVLSFGAGIGACFTAALCMAAGQADEHSARLMDEWLNDDTRAPRLKRMDADVVATWAEAPCIPESHWRN